MNEAVTFTSELERIIKLPRRRTDEAQWAGLADQLTELLKHPRGTMRLFPAQAMALHDIGVCGGAFCPIGVGEGKTLITLLAPYVLGALRPLLLLPAGLIDKTNRDRRELERHWLIPTNIRLFSYEMLGRVQAADELETYDPDLIIGDEIHKLKNRHAAVTRRVARHMHDKPTTRFVALSGTIMTKSLLDFGHIVRWCLKDGAPVPKTDVELEEWASALDEVVSPGQELRRLEPGALLNLCTPEEVVHPAPGVTPVVAARRGFQKRLVETPGVVATSVDKEAATCSIYIRAIKYSVQPITNKHIEKLRGEMLTPDDWQLMEATDVWRHARELALGFHYIWDPRPPDEWRIARRNWYAFVRDVLAYSRTLDSPEHVANACDDGKLSDDALEAWRAVRDTFVPNTVPVWHDDSALRVALDWMKAPGIVWTEHEAFAERLAEMSGAPYYGAEGKTSNGEAVDFADAKRPAILSMKANKEGKNLQHKWSRCLIVSPKENPTEWQQAIARIHRYGQKADQVEVDVFLGCGEHVNAWRRALAGAAAVRDTTGADQKLLIADIDFPSDLEIANYSGARWKSGITPRAFSLSEHIQL